MARKNMSVIFLRQNHLRPDWFVDLSSIEFKSFVGELTQELASYDIELNEVYNWELVIDIKSYADLLNSVKISSPNDGFSSLCVGHIIGQSQNLDLMEDIKKAVKRIAFAPETIPPEDHNRRVCHNCGCGC